MPSEAIPPDAAGLRESIERIRAAIAAYDLVCSGTVLKRMKVCGKSGCACATDRAARHGPYYEWSRREGDRLAHSIISAAEAAALRRAIVNRRRIVRLLRQWETCSVRLIRLTEKSPDQAADGGAQK